MIAYVIAQSPDNRILEKASSILKSGGIICFPTDTNWIIACNPYSKVGVEKLYRLKQEDKKKHFSLLCSDFSKASEVANIDNNAFRILKRIIPGHYTFIFEATKKISRVIESSRSDKQVGIRFVPSLLVNKLLDTYGDILMSTNLVPEMLNVESSDEIHSYLIEEYLPTVELIIDPGEFEFIGSSTIVDFSDSEGPKILRVGAGDVSWIS